MKIIKIKSFLILSILAGVLFSCNVDEESMEDVRVPKTLVTLDKTRVSVTEGTEITFTLNIDSPNNSEMDYKIEVYDAGTTASFRDFSCSGTETTTSDGSFPQGRIGYSLKIPAYATSTTFTITPDLDLLTEGNEVLKLRLVSSGTGLLKVNPNSEIITINIADVVSNDIGVQLVWDHNTVTPFGTIVPGEYITVLPTDPVTYGTNKYTDSDFDLYVFDAGFSEITGGVGATGASPEYTKLLEADLPDGDYYIIADYYKPGGAAGVFPKDATFDFNLSLNVTKFGVWSYSVPVSCTYDHANSYPLGLGGGAIIAAVLTKTGQNYELKDPNTAAVLISGKQALLNSHIGLIRNKHNKK